MKREQNAKERSKRAVKLLESAIDVKISELTQSNRQLKRKVFDLYTIFEISRNFNSVLNYKTLVDSFLLTSLGQVGASVAALYLVLEPSDNSLTLAGSKGRFHGREIPAIVHLQERTLHYLQTSAAPHALADLVSRFDDQDQLVELGDFENGLVIPLIIKSRLKGVLVLGKKVSGQGFANDDSEFLSILANQFVVALENARLYESEKNTLEELKKAQDQLVRTERLAAIGELSAKIAHEVNNPLGIISNYLHLCRRSLDKPEETTKHLGVVGEEISRIARIVRQLLDFHRPRKMEKTPIDVAEIIDDVLALVEWQLEDRQIRVDRKIEESLPRVIGAPEQLKQVFLNLIINARDFMPDGGLLAVEMKGDDSELRIAFTDTGAGIDDEDLPRIFEPFYTTKEGSFGTGLGLSVCYGIISEHGGRIEAGNAENGGGRFIITLPALPVGEEKSC
ncbi:MAG: hypothetical protein GY841_04045 [FCB group bacterium]|nr:hypothetical protein [FCB group bacterium]